MKNHTSPDRAVGSPSPHRLRQTAVLACLVLCIAAGAAGFAFIWKRGRKGPEDGPPAAVPSSSAEKKATADLRPAAAALSPEQAAACEKGLAEFRKYFAAIPEDWREAPNLQSLIKDVQACRDRAEEFLRTCRGASDEHEVQYALARCILNLNRVEWMDHVNAQRQKGKSNEEILEGRADWASKYFGRVVELATASLERCEAGRPLRGKCLDLLGDALYQGGQPAKALERYRQLLEEFPAYPGRASACLAMGKCLNDLGNHAEGIAVLRKAMADLPGDPSFPFFYESLWQLHTGAGDLAGLLKLVEEIRTVLPERLKAPGIGKQEKEAAERYYAYSGFRLGYIRFARGDFPGAIEAFQEHIAYLEELQKKTQIPQDYLVYLTRSKENLQVLTEKIGKVLTGELEKLQWAEGRRPELSGKTLAIVFRNTGDDRSRKFVQALDRHWRQHRDAFDLALVSFMRSTGEPESAQQEEVVQEVRSLEVGCPVGLDQDAENKQVFRAFDATVGSATFVILDRSGTYVWFQQDPWTRDERFSIAILDRIIGPR